ncbi:MAG: glycosyltransferase family 9 protein [Candidatus Omnitrophota bacterium]
MKKSEIKKILVITLSNIGDVILTFPVLDVLRAECPQAELEVVVGPKGEPLFKGNPVIHKVFVFDKEQSFGKMLAFIRALREKRYDLVVDLRNTAIPFLISAKKKTPALTRKPGKAHMRFKHLERLRAVFPEQSVVLAQSSALHISDEDRQQASQLLYNQVEWNQKFVVVSPGARDQTKRWPEERFTEVCDRLIELYQIKIIFVGDTSDRKIVQTITKHMRHNAVNLAGRTTLPQLAALLSQCVLLIANDSAPMHLASYLNVPVLALFGPTDPDKYGPWSSTSCLIRKNSGCALCQNPKAKGEHTCMRAITAEDILKTIRYDGEGVGFGYSGSLR